MAQKNGAQSVETIAGRKIVLSAGVGQTNIDELKWRSETGVLEGHFATLDEALAWLKDEVKI